MQIQLDSMQSDDDIPDDEPYNLFWADEVFYNIRKQI